MLSKFLKNQKITESAGGDTSTSITRGTLNNTTNETSEGADAGFTLNIEISLTPSATVSVGVVKRSGFSYRNDAHLFCSTLLKTGH